MKKAWSLLVLLVGAGAFGQTPEAKKAELVRAEELSMQVARNFEGSKIYEINLGTNPRKSCMAKSELTVICSVTDRNEEMGWIEGLEIEWNVGTGNNGKVWLNFVSIRRIEH